MTANELAPRFFIAAMVILLVCRLVSVAVSRLRQPPVAGEMIAGVLLGPSLLGLLAPGLENAIFSDELRPVLYVAGQVGLVPLMFQAGRELRSQLRRGSPAPPRRSRWAGSSYRSRSVSCSRCAASRRRWPCGSAR